MISPARGDKEICLPAKAALVSSSMSTGLRFVDIIFRNSSKSMAPDWSTSTSLIMSRSSESEGFWPNDRMTSPSSEAVIVPRAIDVRRRCQSHDNGGDGKGVDDDAGEEKCP